MTEREAAIDIADKALGLARRWYLDVRATTRVNFMKDEEIDAADLESATRQAYELWGNHSQTYGDNDLEGDAIGYLKLDEPGDEDQHEEWELDMREEGQAWSWQACALVEELARVTSTNDLASFVVRARELTRVSRKPDPA